MEEDLFEANSQTSLLSQSSLANVKKIQEAERLIATLNKIRSFQLAMINESTSVAAATATTTLNPLAKETFYYIMGQANEAEIALNFVEAQLHASL